MWHASKKDTDLPQVIVPLSKSVRVTGKIVNLVELLLAHLTATKKECLYNQATKRYVV